MAGLKFPNQSPKKFTTSDEQPPHGVSPSKGSVGPRVSLGQFASQIKQQGGFKGLRRESLDREAAAVAAMLPSHALIPASARPGHANHTAETRGKKEEGPAAAIPLKEYPWELKAGLPPAVVRLYQQVCEERLGDFSGSMIKDSFSADFGTIDPAENYWAALVEFPSDFDNSDPAFEGAVGAVIRGPLGNDYEVSSSASGQVHFFGPMELEMERQSFIEWKEDRY